MPISFDGEKVTQFKDYRVVIGLNGFKWKIGWLLDQPKMLGML